MLLVVVLSVLGNLTNPFANSTLRVLVHFIPMVKRGSTDEPVDSATDTLVKSIPKDIRTVKKRLKLNPVVHTFAVCPQCSKVYRPLKLPDGRLDFPRLCTNNVKGKRMLLCKGVLCKDAMVNGEVRRAPIKPYYIHDFDSFKARFMMDPVIEGLLFRGQICSEKEESEDIKDGKHLSQLPGPNGGLFMDPTTGELRLAWNLSTDWGNPFSNKASGKQVSVGSVAATCLNLPPLYRYKMENVYLATVIPGPKEPDVDEIGDYFDIIVDFFLQSYLHGSFFSSTYMHPNGILERSIIAAFVADSPAARKCTGLISTAGKYNMCNVCCMSQSEINELDMTKPCFKPRDLEKTILDAKVWREETGTDNRKRLARKNGVRWSPFYRLPYWNPHKCVIIDGMHDLLLGLVQYHCRTVLGIDEADEEDEAKPLKPAALKKARDRIQSGKMSANYVRKLPICDLLQFCREFNIDTSGFPAEGPLLKRNLRKALFKGITAKRMAATASGAGGETEVPDQASDPKGAFNSNRTVPTLSWGEVEMVQKSIQETQRPRWHKGPPSNFGEKEHGKLKADQWRSVIEFDVPVALAKLSDDGQQAHAKLFRSTMLLAVAIRYATSHKMSERRIKRYTHHILEYLKSIREINPSARLRPNHHNALHIGEYLRLFGPMHGWWMFVFERVIGKLQQVNTNNRNGELEKTMLDSFVAAGNLKATLKHPDAGELVTEIASMLQGAENNRGTLHSDSLVGFKAETGPSKQPKRTTENALEDDIYNAFLKLQPLIRHELASESWNASRRVTLHDTIEIRGHTYSSVAKSSSKLVFCKSGSGQYWPSDIHLIFSVPHPSQSDSILSFIVLRAYNRVLPGMRDPFKEYPEFGASIWRKESIQEPFVVPVLPTLDICHGIMTSWDAHHVVMKPLLRDF
ncbi:hypothetical protein SCHPADRAFT_947876 [Schizopora paradoxa]|uniref:Uncharacterized protein n=1 Tax=Schizopora paradoxa TaxID=27342 RepID=A0A0H2RH56_9AGAM|nr:hypothetical protein SCHPADRAFT_947876 [Schizopora paradoxa]